MTGRDRLLVVAVGLAAAAAFLAGYLIVRSAR